MTTYTEIVESAEARARPILGEVCAQIADVQVRNRGTIGGNICANDPTNHLPPLMVALDAEMTIAGPDGERDGHGGRLLPRRLHDRGRPGRDPDEDHDPAGPPRRLRLDHDRRDGTCIVSAAVSLDGGPRVAIGCVDAVPHRATDVEARLERRPTGAVAGLGATLDPPGDVHAPAAYRRQLAEVVVARAIVEASGRGGAMTAIETSRRITVEVNGISYEREVEARRLLIHFIRDDLELTGSHIGCDTGNCGACSVILDGTLVKSCMLLAVQADGASDRDGRGPRARRRADAAPAGLPRAPRPPVRLLHARDADGGDGLLEKNPKPDRGRDPQGPPGQHLPLHRLLEHRQGRQGRRPARRSRNE